MAEEATAARYEPDPEFEEVKEEAMLDLSPTDSKEFWLIQWVKEKDLDVSDFHYRNISLELNNDGNLGSLESSSGKSFELVSFAYQQPNATVFLPSGSETKPVAKISRRVCLVRHREREGLGTCAAAATAQTSAAEQAPGSLNPGRILTWRDAQQEPKNQLQIYAHRRGMQPPLYSSIQKDTFLFKAKVVIDGQTFESPGEYPRRKAAEMAAAKLALASLPQEAISQVISAGSARKKIAKIKKHPWAKQKKKVFRMSRHPNTARRGRGIWGY